MSPVAWRSSSVALALAPKAHPGCKARLCNARPAQGLFGGGTAACAAEVDTAWVSSGEAPPWAPPPGRHLKRHQRGVHMSLQSASSACPIKASQDVSARGVLRRSFILVWLKALLHYKTWV